MGEQEANDGFLTSSGFMAFRNAVLCLLPVLCLVTAFWVWLRKVMCGQLVGALKPLIDTGQLAHAEQCISSWVFWVSFGWALSLAAFVGILLVLLYGRYRVNKLVRAQQRRDKRLFAAAQIESLFIELRRFLHGLAWWRRTEQEDGFQKWTQSHKDLVKSYHEQWSRVIRQRGRLGDANTMWVDVGSPDIIVGLENLMHEADRLLDIVNKKFKAVTDFRAALTTLGEESTAILEKLEALSQRMKQECSQ